MADAYLKVKDNGANGLAIVREESDVSVTDLKNANACDIITSEMRVDGTHNGLTFTWNSDKSVCHITGTSTASAWVNLFMSSNSLPSNLIPGKEYYLYYSASQNTSRFVLSAYHSGTWNDLFNSRTSHKFVFPSEAVGAIFRIQVSSGQTIDEYVTVSILTADSNYVLTNREHIPSDILWKKYVSRSESSTSSGLTYTPDVENHSVSVSGTCNGISFYNIQPYSTWDDTFKVFEHGKSYYFHYTTTDPLCTLEVFWKNSSDVETKAGQFIGSCIVDFPETAVNFLVRIRWAVQGGTASNVHTKIEAYEIDSETIMRVIGDSDTRYIHDQRIALFGDSIMSGTIKTPTSIQTQRVAKYIQNELKIKTVDGTVGSIGYITHSYLSYNILELVKNVDLTGCTYFVCSAGDNDGSYPIGSYTDTNSSYSDYAATDSGATIMGNIYKLCVYLHQTYPNMTIILCSKPNATSSGSFPTYRRTEGNRIQLLNAEIKKFCDYYGCGFINLDEMGFDGWLLPQVLEPDNVHMTDAGYRKLSLFIAGKLGNFTGSGNCYDNTPIRVTYS